MASRETHFCGACQRRVATIGPHWAWKLAVVAAFVFFTLLTALVGAGGLLILGGGVVVFALGTCVIGPLVAEASRPLLCPTCGREVIRLRAARRWLDRPAPIAAASGSAHESPGRAD
jgi:hypothetical protein